MSECVEQTQLAVVIPARNAAATLPACLAALLQSVPGTRVVVVDDGSIDDTDAQARAAGVRVLSGDGRGPAAARNAGAALIDAEWIVFIDADVRVSADFAATLVEASHDPAACVLQGRYSPWFDATDRVAGYQQIVQHALMERLVDTQIQEVGSFCLAVRGDVFQRIGGFDERFTTASIEDHELGYRLRSAGVSITLVPGLQVDHICKIDLRGLLDKRFRRASEYTRWLLVGGAWRNRSRTIAQRRSYLGRRQLAAVVLAPLVVVGTASAWVLGMPGVALPVPLAFLAVDAQLLFRLVRRGGLSFGAALSLRWLESMALAAGLADGLVRVAVRRTLQGDGSKSGGHRHG